MPRYRSHHVAYTPISTMLTTPIKAAAGVAAVLALMATAACGTSQPPARGTIGALRDKSASQVLQVSLAAARAAGYVKLVEAENDSGNVTMVNGEAGNAAGTQSFTISGAHAVHFTLSLIGHTVFMKANQAALGYALGASAANAHIYANRWISVTSKDSGYRRAVENLKISFQLSTLALNGPLGLQAPTVIRGSSAVGVTGTVNSHQANVGKLSATLYVSTTAPFLPLEMRMHNQSGSVRVEISYSGWGKAFNLRTPRSAVPLSVVQPSAVNG